MQTQPHRTEIAAALLALDILQERNAKLGTPHAEACETVLARAYDLLQAARDDSLHVILRGLGVAEYLGASWLAHHPDVLPSVERLESTLPLAVRSHAPTPEVA